MSGLPTPFADLLKTQKSKEEIRQIVREELKKSASKESKNLLKAGVVLAHGMDQILSQLSTIATAVNAPNDSKTPTNKKSTLLEMLNVNAIADLPLYRVTVKDAVFIIGGSIWGVYGLFSFGHQMHWW